MAHTASAWIVVVPLRKNYGNLPFLPMLASAYRCSHWIGVAGMETTPVVTESIANQALTAIVEQATAALGAPAWIVNARGSILASSAPDQLGAQDSRAQGAQESLRIRSALTGHNDSWMVIDLGRVLDPTDAGALRLAQAYLDLLARQLAIASIPDRQQLKAELIQNLLFASNVDEEQAQRQGDMLGMDLRLPRAVILVDASASLPPTFEGTPPEEREALGQRAVHQAIQSIVSYFHLPSDTICAYLGAGEIAVLKAASVQDLRAWADDGDRPPEHGGASWANLAALRRACKGLLERLRRDTCADMTIGIGRYHPGVAGIARSYADARAALTSGRRLHGANRLHSLDQLGVAAFVAGADERTKLDLAQRLLSPLAQEPDLLLTLQAFFANDCSPSATAAALCVHRNTVRFRLEKVAVLTGLDPCRFDDAVQIRLALLLDNLREERA
jgi:carbohydrate diacid regulator